MTSAIDQGRFREVLSHFASGVVVVTGRGEAGPLGFTCQSFTALSLEPPLVLVAAAKASTSWRGIAASGYYCVNVLAADQEALALGFAVSGGDKFEGVGHHAGPTGSPVLEGALAYVDCELEAVHDAGDHVVAIGAVRELGLGEGSPLLYYRSGFAGLER